MNNINYREDQIPIISYERGTMAVPAVPGAGKTFIVTNLVAKLLVASLITTEDTLGTTLFGTVNEIVFADDSPTFVLPVYVSMTALTVAVSLFGIKL